LTASVALGPRIAKLGLRTLEEKALAAADRLAALTSTFPLRDAAKAHTALENRDTVGKVVHKP
jgi:NADPH2:quinone reductase